VDLLLLDLNLSGRNGFELLHRAVAGAFHTVVISANTDRAIEAFDYGVVDFVPKPFSRERLARAFERALRAEEGAGRGAATTLAVKKRGAIVMVPIAEISYIRGAGPYSELVIRRGTVELHDKSLDALMCVLPPSFHRTHKSYVVPLADIDTLLVHEGTRYELVLRSGERLPVGRSRYQALRQRLGLER
jgi:two-component system response regulator LytT